MKRRLPFLVAAACLVAATGCAAAHRATLPLRVAVALAPLGDIARGVGGSWVTVDDLVPPGSDPHEHDPTPKEIDRLQQADAVVYLRGFQPALDRAIDSLPKRIVRIDLFDGLSRLADDPHVWLSPATMQHMAKVTATAFEQLVADRTPQKTLADHTIAVHLANYLTSLTELDNAMRDGLAHCATRTIVSSHRSFGYLARDYRLDQAGIAGLSPGDEPSAKQLQAMIDLARDHHIATIFFDRNMPSDLARTVARSADARVAVLDPVETFTAEQVQQGATYASVMRQNLAELRTGLECT